MPREMSKASYCQTKVDKANWQSLLVVSQGILSGSEDMAIVMKQKFRL